MSAAEKLQTLVEEFWEDTAPSGHEAPVEVVRALPQIVAVVQAAQGERSPHHADYWEREKDCPLCVALVALDEALP